VIEKRVQKVFDKKGTGFIKHPFFWPPLLSVYQKKNKLAGYQFKTQHI